MSPEDIVKKRKFLNQQRGSQEVMWANTPRNWSQKWRVSWDFTDCYSFPPKIEGYQIVKFSMSLLRLWCVDTCHQPQYFREVVYFLRFSLLFLALELWFPVISRIVSVSVSDNVTFLIDQSYDRIAVSVLK